MHKRVLWVEDFNDGKDKDILRKIFINASGLNDNEIEWAETFEFFLDKIDGENIYDTIILDINFPVKTPKQTQERVKKYITEKAFNKLTDKNKSNNEPNNSGYIASLYILRSKTFDPDRICFLSAYVPDDTSDIQPMIDNIIDNIIMNLSEGRYTDLVDEWNTEYSNNIENDKAPFKYWGNEDGDLHSKDEVEKYLRSAEFKKLFGMISNHQSNNAQHHQTNNDKTNFHAFKLRFEETGMKFLKYYAKPGQDKTNEKFKFFLNTNSTYFRFRFAVINMCYILIDWINSSPDNRIINSQIFSHPNKYSKEDFRSMLKSIVSYLKEYIPSENIDNRVYKDIVMTLTMYAEDLNYSKCGNLYPLQRVIKALRNGLQHNSPAFDSSWDMSFCAFVVGISLRLYFNIGNLSYKNYKDYNKMEGIILNSISEEKFLPSTMKIKEIAKFLPNDPLPEHLQFKIPAYGKLTSTPESKSDIYKLYTLCSYYDEDSYDKNNNRTTNDPIRNDIFNNNTNYGEGSPEVKYLRRIKKYISSNT